MFGGSCPSRSPGGEILTLATFPPSWRTWKWAGGCSSWKIRILNPEKAETCGTGAWLPAGALSLAPPGDTAAPLARGPRGLYLHLMPNAATRSQRTYDRRLVRLVQETGDATIATRLGVPRSTAAGWARSPPREVTTAPDLADPVPELRARLARLERRVRRLLAFVRLLLALVHVLQPDLTRVRVPAEEKRRLLRAVERARSVLGLRRALALVGISASRFAAWRNAERRCELADRDSCPHLSPQRLTPDEISAVAEMATSPDFRHVPTGRLAMLAQRLGRVVASPTTWYRFLRERGWRRPRARLHPEKPEVGLRASRPDEVWHIDTTVIRLLDGVRLYLHAVIDNFSRRILAWRIADTFDPANAVAVLTEAGRHLLVAAAPPTLLADQGFENRNAAVDALIEQGLLMRIFAMTQLAFSNSMIERFWQSLKHGWLFLHPLETLVQVRRLVEFYVTEHNTRLPHSAFRGQTPDEMYCGTGSAVPEQLARSKAEAREQRLALNRAQRCAVCA